MCGQKMLYHSALIGAGLLSASPAAATTTISISGDIPLQAGGFFGVSANFDLSPYLNSGGSKLKVTSAHLSASGTSNQQLQIKPGKPNSVVSNYLYISGYTTISTPHYYACGPLLINTCVYYTYYDQPNYSTGTKTEIYQDINETDAQVDIMLLKSGGQSAAGSDNYGSSTSAYGVSAQSGSPYGPTWTINYQRTITSGYFGALTAGFDLDGASLNALNQSGNLLATISAGQGQFRLQQLSLAFDLAPLSSGVPEPTSWAMLVTGFGLMGSRLRRRRPHGQLASAA